MEEWNLFQDEFKNVAQLHRDSRGLCMFIIRLDYMARLIRRDVAVWRRGSRMVLERTEQAQQERTQQIV